MKKKKEGSRDCFVVNMKIHSFISYTLSNWFTFVDILKIEPLKLRKCLFWNLCDVIKQNESEVSEIQFFILLTDCIHHSQSYLSQ